MRVGAAMVLASNDINVEGLSVLLKKTLVAGTDPVALDAYVAKAYWNLEVGALPYLKMAAARGLGTYRFEKVRTRVKKLA